MSRLTGIKKDGQIEDLDEDEDSESEQPARQVMTIDFSQKVDAAVNMKLIDRVSDLVYKEQKVRTFLCFQLRQTESPDMAHVGSQN